MDTPDPQFDDFDAVLRNTPTPPDLAARTQAAAQLPLSEAEIDDALRDLAVPSGLQARILHGSRVELSDQKLSSGSRSDWTRAIAWGTAACLLLAVSLLRWQSTTLSTTIRPSQLSSVVYHGSGDSTTLLSWLGPQPVDIASVDLTSGAPLDSAPATIELLASKFDFQPQPTALDEQLVHLASDLPADLMADAFLMRWKPLGARPLIDASPREIYRAPSTDRQAEYFSLAAGFDRQFLLREEEQPFVSLPNPKLNSITAPLVAAGSWREVVSQVTGETGVGQPIRLEELAALGGALFIEAGRHEIALRTAAGPAVFANSSVQMLQVGLVAGSADIVDRPPTHLTIAVDLTVEMQHSGRWESVREALDELIDRMSPYDTVSLVCIDEFSHTLVENATVGDSAAWRATLQELEPNDSDCLAEGIRFSSAVALRTSSFGDIRRPLIVISDRFDQIGDADRSELKPLIDDANSQQVDYHWFAIDADEHYQSIAKFWSEHGSFFTGDHELPILHELEQIIFAQSTRLANDIQLTVHWNPKSVASYRLVGCQVEAAAMGAGQAPLELHSDEAAATLFELVLTPDGPNEVARIEATWREPATSKLKTATQVVSRLQFAPSWEASPLSLQAAQLAVQAGGLMRESYFVRQRGGDSGELSSLLQRANRQLSRRPEFAYLEQLVRATERRRTNGF